MSWTHAKAVVLTWLAGMGLSWRLAPKVSSINGAKGLAKILLKPCTYAHPNVQPVNPAQTVELICFLCHVRTTFTQD